MDNPAIRDAHALVVASRRERAEKFLRELLDLATKHQVQLSPDADGLHVVEEHANQCECVDPHGTIHLLTLVNVDGVEATASGWFSPDLVKPTEDEQRERIARARGKVSSAAAKAQRKLAKASHPSPFSSVVEVDVRGVTGFAQATEANIAKAPARRRARAQRLDEVHAVEGRRPIPLYGEATAERRSRVEFIDFETREAKSISLHGEVDSATGAITCAEGCDL